VEAENIRLSPRQAEGLKSLSNAEGVTLFMTLLAAFKVLLARHAGQDDITVGTPVAGRNRAEVEHLIGFFVNTLVLRTDLSGDPTFRELLARVRETALGAYAHQDVPFERLVEELHPERDMSRTPLFQVLFVFQNTPREELELPGLELGLLDTGSVREDSEWVVSDLVLSAVEDEGGLAVGCKYDPDLFDAATVRRLLERLSLLVDAVNEDAGRSIHRLPIMTEAERRQLLVEWDRTRVERAERRVEDEFEAWAEAQPDAPAVSFAGHEMSYRELSVRSGQIAAGLAGLGVRPGQPVAVALDTGPTQVAALLGVLKAGAYFVCLDPQYPPARLQQILEEVEPHCVLAAGAGAALLRAAREVSPAGLGCDVVLLPDAPEEVTADELVPGMHDGRRWFEQVPPARRVSAGGAHDLAYVVYTSGSTGKPKGIMQTHDGLCQYVEFQARQFEIGPGRRVAQWASITYDAAYAEIFGALCSGATLSLTAPGVRAEPTATLGWLRDERVSVLITVPSFARHLFEQLTEGAGARGKLPDLEYLLLAGEALPVAFAAAWLERFPRRPRLYNLYGPTEAILATFYEVTSADAAQASIPVGNAIDGRHMLVLDRARGLAPVGARGELYIRSPYLTRGYLGQPEETAEVFIQNPLHNDYPDPVYRTGDLGRWLAVGALELFGRADNQVKIRGMRVELEEIEAAIARHPGVSEAAVFAREQESGERRLAACVAPADGLTAAGLRAFLKESLPGHMTPTEFAFLDALPRTRSGKIDRPALASVATFGTAEGLDFVEPRTELEAEVAAVWRELLGVERVGIYDNFFDLGGHSLLATQVVNRLRQEHAVELQLRDFFESPTVADLALLVEAGQGAGAAPGGDELADLLERIRQLPEAEVESLLRRQGLSPGSSND
jgi:amino acid adenylation domain-containing protein